MNSGQEKVLELRCSEAVSRMPWAVSLGLVTVRGINPTALESALASAQQLITFDDAQELTPASRRIQAFESFFSENGFRSPLGDQLRSVKEKGLPGGNPLVRALLLCEMSTGLLMGAQDASAIKGALVCDLAQAGESFEGMRATVLCRQDEIVLRDSEGIIATLFQGPDRRTRLKKDTKDVVFFIFSVPAIAAADVQEGVAAVSRLFQSACADLDAQVI